MQVPTHQLGQPPVKRVAQGHLLGSQVYQLAHLVRQIRISPLRDPQAALLALAGRIR